MKIKFVKYPYRRYKIKGCYCGRGIIHIQKDLGLRGKITTIIHELGHYLIDKVGLSSSWDYVYDVLDTLIGIKKKYHSNRFLWLAKYYYGKH